jgi:hippurate hydrolase
MRRFLLALPLCLTMPALADPLHDAVAKDVPSLLAVYRDFHANPELPYQEVNTARKLATEFKRLDYDVTTGVGKTGVVAVLKNGPGPVLLIRADMDALPVAEQTGLPFASKARGTTAEGKETAVMHACGHDTHLTTMFGVARQLAARKSEWSGTLVLIGQPAEELVSGAKAMLKDGLYARFPKPQVALAFHDVADLPAGVIGLHRGYIMASNDSIDILVKGVGGHGAWPHTTKDPIVLASRIVTSLQTLVSREVDPIDSAVVTVGSFQAGIADNVIPDQAALMVTTRSFSPETRAMLLDGIARIAKGEAISAGVPEDRMPVVTVKDNYTPSTFNIDPLTGTLSTLFTQRFGGDRVIDLKPMMGAEDFSEYWRADKSIQSVYFMVGGVPKATWDVAKGDPAKLPSLHSAFWAPDAEAVIATATEAMTAAALDVLKKR